MVSSLIRFTCWLGAIIDVLAGVQFLLPRSATVFGFEGQRPPGAVGLPAITAAVLMFGFTAILVWAQARPIERRAVLLITLAVIVSLAVVNLVAGCTGVRPWNRLLPALCIQTVLGTLFAVSYIAAIRSLR